MAATNKSSEITLTRVYDAPLSTVWSAWTDPKQAAHWWGPRGFTITTHAHDLRTGGSWKYTMHSPDGVDYPNTTQYLLVEKEAKLVYDHGGNEDSPPMFRVTALFTEVDGKTQIEMTMALPTPEAAENTRKFIKKAGGDATWDRLAEYLEKEATGKEQFVINRSFDVPIETMFEMWTDPKHFSQWLPPTGFKMEFIRADIRAGGSSFYVMSGQGDMKMYGRASYLEIEKPNRIVYTQQFCDAQENISRHPMAPTFPATMRSTVTLTAEGPDRTRVTVAWEAYGAVTPQELENFVKMRAGMTLGWTGSFDKLEALLSGQ